MSQEDSETFLAELENKPIPGKTTTAVPDDQFDDSFDQIKNDIG